MIHLLIRTPTRECLILPLSVDFINENASVANPDPHSQNSFYSQISIRGGCAYGMLDGGCLLLYQQ